MDFTVSKYKQLCEALKACCIEFELRHDIDLKPINALRIAQMEYALGLQAIYYFRYMDIWNNPDIIRQIASLGHTIGYHYESLTTANGDLATAYEDFKRNLAQLRTIAPVTTACAHGSPRSPYNSMDMWKHYDIRATGIEYEPMIDTDFNRTLYLTDTGRRWDGYRVSVRDRVLERPYAVFRFVGWSANHDVGNNGFSLEQKIQLVKAVEGNMQVYISSEKPLPEELCHCQLHTPASLMHHVLAFADLYLGDSQTMATEAALLGTPAIRSNSFVGEHDMTNFKLLESRYGLLNNIAKFDDVLHYVKEYASHSRKAEWKIKRDNYYSETGDLNQRITDLLLDCNP